MATGIERPAEANLGGVTVLGGGAHMSDGRPNVDVRLEGVAISGAVIDHGRRWPTMKITIRDLFIYGK